jgi:Flp pilus assembly protein TadG
VRNASGRDNQRYERGGVSIEFVFGVPALLFVVLSGLTLGRALLTRHRLADATGFAARAAAVEQETSPDVVQELVQRELGTEAARCTSLVITTDVVPGAGEGEALQVTATCALQPMFGSELLSVLGPEELVVVAAMPL